MTAGRPGCGRLVPGRDGGDAMHIDHTLGPSSLVPTIDRLWTLSTAASREGATVPVHRIGIIMNGVTGRIGANQHLLSGAKGAGLAELGIESWRTRSWVAVPGLEV